MSEVGFTTPLFWRRIAQFWFAIMVFLFLSVVASNWAGKTCQDFDQPAEARLTSCARAWWIGLSRWAVEPDEKMAGFWFYYGAAHADLGHRDIARDYYSRALAGVDLRPPVTLPDDLATANYAAPNLLHEAARLPMNSPARLLLEEVLIEGR